MHIFGYGWIYGPLYSEKLLGRTLKGCEKIVGFDRNPEHIREGAEGSMH